MLKERENITHREIEEGYELSPLASIPDDDMYKYLSFPGFENTFDTSSLRTENEYHEEFNESTEGFYMVKRGMIAKKHAEEEFYEVKLTYDLDNRGIAVCDQQGQPVFVVNLRDRTYDSTPYATSPAYLMLFDGLTPQAIPERSRYIGGTNWYYSSPEYDRPRGISAELSVVSSDPAMFVENFLHAKNEKLFPGVDPQALAKFIDDPFASLYDPQCDIATWHKYWWQVVNRGMRGKDIPLPGQTSQHGFEGFLDHIIAQSGDVLRSVGYEYLDAVPTWAYVERSFKNRGFQPLDQQSAERIETFHKALDEITLPDFAQRALDARQIGELQKNKSECLRRNALKAWIGVLPFAFDLQAQYGNLDVIPDLHIQREYQQTFTETLALLRDKLIVKDGDSVRICHYPLAPKENLWYSISVDKI